MNSNNNYNKSNTLLKNKLAIAVSTALILTTSQIVYAAEVTTEAEVEVNKVDETEIIEVSGFRGSATRQLNNKRFAKNITDSIFAEDMGKMPDSNIAEAMSRITGIGIDRTDGEGTEITIRGAEGSLNNVQMNGVTMTNSGDDNSVDFSAMSADMLRSIEVIKTPSANHDEGAIGGTVKLNTWKPLDIKEPKAVISVQAAYNDLSEETHQTVSLSLGKNFTDSFGMTFGANYSSSNVRQDRLTNYNWQYRNVANVTSYQTGEELDPDGSTRVFDQVGYEKNLSFIETKRLNFSSTLQYNINDDASVWLDATYSDKYKNKLQWNNTAQNMRTTAVVDEVAMSSLMSESTNANGRLVTFEQPNDSKTTTLGLNYQQILFDGAWTLDTLLGYSHSSSFSDVDNRRLIFNSQNRREPAGINWLDDNGNILLSPVTTFESGDSHVAAEDAQPTAVSFLTRDTTDTGITFQMDMQGDVEFGPIVGLGFGFKVVDRDRSGQSLNYVADLNDPDFVNEEGKMLSEITLADYAGDFPVDNFLNRVVGTTIDGWPVPDVNAIYDTYLPDPKNSAGYQDLLLEEPPETTTFNSTALYLMADYEFFDGRLLGDFGVRYVETKSYAKGRAGYRFTGYDPEGNVDADTGEIIGGAFNDGNFDLNDDSFGDINYDNWLPSINARYMISDNMILRAGVGKVMSRPKPSLLIPGNLISARNNNEATATAGNPELNPTEVIAYDLSWEWYYSETGMVSVAPFYKDFVSMTYEKQTQEGFECASEEAFFEIRPDQVQYMPLHCGRIAEDVTTTQNVNGDGGEIYGVELAYQQDFNFLPGWAQYFGTIINYTYADSMASYVDPEQQEENADLLDGFPMLNTSKNVLNATLYWENEGFSARLAYNYRSKRLNTAIQQDGALWTDDRATVDFSASYKVNKNLSFNLSATNLTDTYNRIFITRLQVDGIEGEEGYIGSEGSAFDGAPDWRTYILDHNGRNFRLGAVYKF